ncbi:MAG: PAS domain S-box protein, partial [bacterium]
RADRELRSELLQQTLQVTAAVRVAQVKALTGTTADLNQPDYQQLTAQLQAICAANPNWRWLYLMGRRLAPQAVAGQPPHTSAAAAIFFYLDSEPAKSKDHAPPGQLYSEAPASFHRVFDTGQPVTKGPYTDSWGSWISALVPLTDPRTGAVLAVLGVDIDAYAWEWEVVARAALPAGLILLLLIGAATVFAVTRRAAAAPKPVLRRLLPPLTLMVCLLLVGAGLLLYRQHQHRLAAEIADQVVDTANDLHVALDQQGNCLAIAAQFIATTPSVQQALRTGDAASLLTTWQPRFELLRQQHVLTHFYFFTANRTCLLRLHQPETGGDRIMLATAIASERTGRTAAGLELGPLGTLTLRAVQPVVVGGQHVGAVELGKEIEDILIKRLCENRDLELAVIIRKEYLTRAAWEDGRRRLGQDADWDRLPHVVVNYASQGRLPDAMAAWADPATGIPIRHETDRKIAYDGKVWQLAATPLLDAAGQAVGELLVMRDVSSETAALTRLITMGGVAGTVLMALLLSFFYVLLRRTDAGILAQQITLRDSVTRFDQLAAQSGTVIWEVNHQGLYTYVSHTAETVFGYRPDELTGHRHFYDLHPEVGLEAYKNAAFAVFARQEPFMDLVNEVQTKDGRQRWVSTNGLPVLNANGSLRGYRGSDTDVTEREHAAAHGDQQLQFANALNAIAETIISQDQAGVILESANRVIGETLQLDRTLIYVVDFEHHHLTGLCEWLRTPHPDLAPTKGRYDLTLFSSPLAAIKNSGAYLESQAANVNPYFIPDGSGNLLHGQMKIKSLLWYPFAFNEHGYHLFTLNQILAPRQWTAEELAFLESAATQISLALIKIRLLEQRQQQAQQVRESEAHFRSYFELPLHGAAITSPEKGWLEVNDQLCAMLGYSRAELRRLTWAELTHPADLAADTAAFDRLLAGQIDQYQMEKRFIRKDGTVTWINLAVGCTRNADGRVHHALALLDDINNRKQSEAERDRLVVAIEQAAEIIVITDAQGIIEYVNPRFTAVTGYSSTEAVGHNLRLLQSGQQDAAFYRDLWDTIASGKIWQGRFVNRKKNGMLYTEDATISPVLDATGAIISYVALKRDITEHLILHAQLTQAQKMESVGRLAGGVAHDFNNILQAILGGAELAVEQTAPGDLVRRDLEEIQSAAHRAAALTRQLLAFARKQVITPRTLDLNDAVEGVLKM